MKIAGSLLVAAMLILSLSLGLPRLLENFHAVTNGVIYRSAQLREDSLIRKIEKYGIRSILNLRGVMTGMDWYDEELDVSKRMEVAHYDIDLSAKRNVSPERLEKIVALIADAPKPILIHCQGGADRTGLVCAAWKLVMEHESPDAARRQLSILFGHFPHLFWRESAAMDASFKALIKATLTKSGTEFPMISCASSKLFWQMS